MYTKQQWKVHIKLAATISTIILQIIIYLSFAKREKAKMQRRKNRILVIGRRKASRRENTDNDHRIYDYNKIYECCNKNWMKKKQQNR